MQRPTFHELLALDIFRRMLSAHHTYRNLDYALAENNDYTCDVTFELLKDNTWYDIQLLLTKNLRSYLITGKEHTTENVNSAFEGYTSTESTQVFNTLYIAFSLVAQSVDKPGEFIITHQSRANKTSFEY